MAPPDRVQIYPRTTLFNHRCEPVMSNLYRSAISARLSKLPQLPPIHPSDPDSEPHDDNDDDLEDDEVDGLGELPSVGSKRGMGMGPPCVLLLSLLVLEKAKMNADR